MANILSTRNVTKRFGGLVAVDNFSVEIKENSISAVIGPNGAGTTTIIKILKGILKPTSGTFSIENVN